jgi:hypothetical protein
MEIKEMIEIVKETEFNDDIKNKNIINNGKKAVIEILEDNKGFFNNNDEDVYKFLLNQEYTDDCYIMYLDKYVPVKLLNEAWSKYFSLLNEVFEHCFALLRCDIEDLLYNEDRQTI